MRENKQSLDLIASRVIRIDFAIYSWGEEKEKHMFRRTSQSSVSCWQERETLWYLGGLRILQAFETQTQQIGPIFEYLEPVGTPSGPARILTWTTPMGFAQQVTSMGIQVRRSYSPPRLSLRARRYNS